MMYHLYAGYPGQVADRDCLIESYSTLEQAKRGGLPYVVAMIIYSERPLEGGELMRHDYWYMHRDKTWHYNQSLLPIIEDGELPI